MDSQKERWVQVWGPEKGHWEVLVWETDRQDESEVKQQLFFKSQSAAIAVGFQIACKSKVAFQDDSLPGRVCVAWKEA